jgi:hypothetical protein
VGVILEEVWQGRQTFNCDGELRDISLLAHLLSAPIKKVKNQRVFMRDLLLNGFSYGAVTQQHYWFQFQFRTNSIDYIFKKDFFSALAMVVVF